MSRVILVILCYFIGVTAYAQLTSVEKEMLAPLPWYGGVLDHSLQLNLQGLPSYQDKLPFWMYHNSRGRISVDSHVAAWITGKTLLYLNDTNLILFGVGIAYNDGENGGILTDEIFAHYENPFFYLSLGKKQRPEFYKGLGASNENMLWSLNTRPLPGIQLGTTSPVFFFPSELLGFEAAWNEFFVGSDGFVEDSYIHHKKLNLVMRHSSWELKLGFHHFAQWGGHSQRLGAQPENLRNYLEVIRGNEGMVSNPQNGIISSKGNHLGTYNLVLKKDFRDFSLEFFYNHIFDDISGRRFQNFPDGRYGLFYDSKESDQLISSAIYELYYTQHQSHDAVGFHKHDNYLNNGTYQSGWTYENRVIGAPFFTPDPDGKGVINNKFVAHHIGIAGEIGNYFSSFPYKLLLSYAHNDGRYTQRFRPQQDAFYGLAEVLLLQKEISLNLQVGLELKSTSAPIYGLGFHLSFRL